MEVLQREEMSRDQILETCSELRFLMLYFITRHVNLSYTSHFLDFLALISRIVRMFSCCIGSEVIQPLKELVAI
jgi:hypothetical protein